MPWPNWTSAARRSSCERDGRSTGESPATATSIILISAPTPSILEHLTGLDRLDCPHFDVFAVPVKVRGMGSFPVRAFGVCDD